MDPDLAGLVGTWQTEREAVSQSDGPRVFTRGYAVSDLTIAADGSYVWEQRTHGVYEGQPADEITAFHTTSGTVERVRDRLTFVGLETVSWDRFYGGLPQVSTSEVPTWDAQYRIVAANVLILTYFTYPADAPILTQVLFHRVH